MDSKELVYVEMDFDDVGSHTYEWLQRIHCKHGSDKHFVKSVFSSAKEEDLKFFYFSWVKQYE